MFIFNNIKVFCFLTFSCVLSHNLFCTDTVETRSIEDEVLVVAAETLGDLSDVLTTPKPEKKKKKRRFFKKLLVSAVNLAIKVIYKNRGTESVNNYEDIQKLLVELCHDLRNALEAEKMAVQSVFLMGNCDERERLIYKHLNSSIRNRHLLLQEIFSELFSYYSYKLLEFHVYVQEKVLEVSTQTIDSRSIDQDDYREFYEGTQSVLDRVMHENKFASSRANVPSILCFMMLVTKMCDLVFENQDDEKNKNVTEKFAVLLKELHDFIAADDMLESFEKFSSFITRLDEAQSNQEWHALAEDFLESSNEGIDFLSEIFSCLHIYLGEKLSDIFANVFYLLADAVED